MSKNNVSALGNTNFDRAVELLDELCMRFSLLVKVFKLCTGYSNKE